MNRITVFVLWVVLSTGADWAQTLTITSQPQDTSGVAYGSAHFSIGVTADSVSAPAYQWRRNGVNAIVGNSSRFGFIISPSDTNALFDCVVTIPGLTNT